MPGLSPLQTTPMRRATAGTGGEAARQSAPRARWRHFFEVRSSRTVHLTSAGADHRGAITAPAIIALLATRLSPTRFDDMHRSPGPRSFSPPSPRTDNRKGASTKRWVRIRAGWGHRLDLTHLSSCVKGTKAGTPGGSCCDLLSLHLFVYSLKTLLPLYPGTGATSKTAATQCPPGAPSSSEYKLLTKAYCSAPPFPSAAACIARATAAMNPSSAWTPNQSVTALPRGWRKPVHSLDICGSSQRAHGGPGASVRSAAPPPSSQKRCAI